MLNVKFYCMKKKIILLSFLILLTSQSFSQFRIGLSVQPGINNSRISSQTDSLTYLSAGSSFKIWPGLFFEFEMQQNYIFSTGIYWTPKKFDIQLASGQEIRDYTKTIQYIQLPLYLKLLTDEISLDKKIYFDLGPALEVKVEESLGGDEEEVYIDDIKSWNISLHFGAGIEMRIGINTIVTGGVSYYRGMVNSINPDSLVEDSLRIKSDFYALNLGIKF